MPALSTQYPVDQLWKSKQPTKFMPAVKVVLPVAVSFVVLTQNHPSVARSVYRTRGLKPTLLRHHRPDLPRHPRGIRRLPDAPANGHAGRAGGQRIAHELQRGVIARRLRPALHNDGDRHGRHDFGELRHIAAVVRLDHVRADLSLQQMDSFMITGLELHHSTIIWGTAIPHCDFAI